MIVTGRFLAKARDEPQDPFAISMPDWFATVPSALTQGGLLVTTWHRLKLWEETRGWV